MTCSAGYKNQDITRRSRCCIMVRSPPPVWCPQEKIDTRRQKLDWRSSGIALAPSMKPCHYTDIKRALLYGTASDANAEEQLVPSIAFQIHTMLFAFPSHSCNQLIWHRKKKTLILEQKPRSLTRSRCDCDSPPTRSSPQIKWEANTYRRTKC